MSLYTRLVEYMELSEGRPFSVANQEKNKAARMGLVHLGGQYYGPEKGQDATHKSVRRNPNNPKEEPDIVPMTKKDLKQYKSDMSLVPQTKAQLTKKGKSKMSAGGIEEPPPPQYNFSPAEKIMASTAPGKVMDPAQQKALRQADVQKVQDNLYITKQASKQRKALQKAQEKATGKKMGIGLGTDKSRAGECAVVSGIQFIANQFKTNSLSATEAHKEALKKLDSYYKSLRQDIHDRKAAGTDVLLDDAWINSAYASAVTILEQVGVGNISDVIWDTTEGRHLLGTTGLDTTADMFIRTKNNKIIGISLKKTGHVILRNGGLSIMIDSFKNDLAARGMPPKEIDRFVSECGDQEYNVEFISQLQKVQKFYQKNLEFQQEMTSVVKALVTGKILDTYEAKRYAMKMDLGKIFSTPPDQLKNDEIKLLTRMISHMKSSKKFSAIADDMDVAIRAPHNRLNGRLKQWLGANTEVNDRMKEEIFRNVHLYETLGIDLNKSKMNKFITVYGEQTTRSDGGVRGMVMDANALIEFFGIDTPSFEAAVLKARTGDKTAIKVVQRMVRNRISVDHSGAGMQSDIKYKRKNPQPPPPLLTYTIFNISIKIKGLGVAPSFNISQSPGMTSALTYGTDLNKWPDRARQIYYKSEYESTLSQLIDQNPHSVTGKRLAGELELLKSKFKYTPAWEKKALERIAKERAEEDNDE